MWLKINHIAVCVIKKLFTKLHYDISPQQIDNIIQLVKFGLVGVSNTLVAYFVYIFLCMVGFSYHISNMMGVIMSMFNAFYWNNRYVFKAGKGETRVWWKALVKTFVSYGLSSLILSEILLIFWIQVVETSQYIAPILSLFITIPLNFLMNKFWVFKKGK